MISMLLGLLALCQPTLVRADPPPACQVNTDCVVLPGACPGSWETGPQSEADHLKAEIAKHREVIQCVTPTQGGGPTPKALCLSGRCRLVRLSVVDTKTTAGAVKLRRSLRPIPLPSPSKQPE